MKQEQAWDKSWSEFTGGIEKQFGETLEQIAETFVGKADSLRNGTEHAPVTLPRDLYAHRHAQTEWWYYTGHAKTASGREFGFELVFFKRRTDLDKFNLVPLRLFGNPLYFAHFAITDKTNKQFRYSHRKSAGRVFDMPTNFSEKHYYLRLGNWAAREAHGIHILRATLGQETIFEATAKPVKSPVLQGKSLDGVSFKDEGEASRYFTYSRMELEGDITWSGETEHFHGTAWMDREFGTWTPTEKQKGWDWFSIQLDNNCEMMCYQLRDSAGNVSPYSAGSFVQENGNVTYLSADDIQITTTGFWKSKKTGATYPSGWQVRVDKLALDLTVEPVMEDQELDTLGTTMIVYWEGACEVKGSAAGTDVKGRCYTELVGYDRSHDNPNLGYFMVGNSW